MIDSADGDPSRWPQEALGHTKLGSAPLFQRADTHKTREEEKKVVVAPAEPRISGIGILHPKTRTDKIKQNREIDRSNENK
uniref:Uncharacterized protein n=1 Tax=Arundo donax TaxID=35708 RepID=A0A0A8XNZ0_ARUDO